MHEVNLFTGSGIGVLAAHDAGIETVAFCVLECFGQLAQLVRALGSHPRGRRFESFTAHCTFIKMYIRSEVVR